MTAMRRLLPVAADGGGGIVSSATFRTVVAAAFSSSTSLLPITASTSAPSFLLCPRNPRTRRSGSCLLQYYHTNQSPLVRVAASQRREFATPNLGDDCGCDAAPYNKNSFTNTSSGTASMGSLLRNTVLTNSDGEAVQLGQYIENDTNAPATIVVFLRHLA